MLVADLAEDDFEQVLHGGEAGGVAVLVDHDDHVRAFLLHFTHKVVNGFGFGDETDGPHQFAHGARLAAAFGDFEHIAHMDEADDVVN